MVRIFSCPSKNENKPRENKNNVNILCFLWFFFFFVAFGERFSVSMAILNLVYRPVSVIMMGKVCAERMGLNNGFPVRFGNLFGKIIDCFNRMYWILFTSLV